MKLRYSPTSPFVRKVSMAALALGLESRIENVPADTMNPDDTLARENPLGQVPALILDDGAVIVDSRVICDYLDGLAGMKLRPTEPEARARVLTQEALADGILDAMILQRYEAMFHEAPARSPRWLDRQAGKVKRGLAWFEAAPPTGPLDIAQITLACALGYLDLRFEGAWRAEHPRLVAWLEAFAARTPSWAATAPPR